MTLLRWAGRRLRELPGAVWYLAVGAVTGALALVALVVLFLVGALSLGIVGIPAIPETIRLLRPLTGLERLRAGGRLGEPIPGVYQTLDGPLRRQLATVFRDVANMRDIGWVALHAVLGVPIGLFAVALPLALINQLAIPAYWRFAPENTVDNFGIPVDSWGPAWLSALLAIPLAVLVLQIPVVARWQALTARAALGPSESALAARVTELTETRAAALDAHGAELRRIERDLHDGAQARIAAVIMQLGLADQLRQQDPERAADLVRRAQDTATDALAELRDVVRSVYPPVLADRGLPSAVSALAARSPIPCTVDIDWLGESGRLGAREPLDADESPRPVGSDDGYTPGGDIDLGSTRVGAEIDEQEIRETARRPAAVEAAAYFVIAEALTNATKHSGAEQVSVTLGGAAETLTVEVRDDGLGNAREREGGGLAGIRRRAEALDGRMLLSSPEGGPTVVRVELPCGS
ncbi:sensor histidine kinase [Nocardia jejuensis]|uniref:sensor histidine kinase n=1 Tax=Nocardia jejuensis TaxID=328049 RepID=UPI0008351BD2|nr:sensor histidine kinase [Nocardia jejuensis]